MNLKKVVFTTSSLLLITAILSGCSFTPSFEAYDYGVIDKDTHKEEKGPNYLKISDYEPLRYKGAGGVDEQLDTYLDVYRHKNLQLSLNTTGEAKILVIPVDFEDYTIKDMKTSEEVFFTNLNNAFFGKAEKTKYESVASFFDKSSYGKLKIKGKVVDKFYRSPFSYNALSKTTDKQKTIDIYKGALAWYKENYNNIEDYYVEGKEELGVPVYLIYTAPASNTNDSIFWAYTFMANNLFSWSSYHMMNLDYRNMPDSHTYIHETGHLLSLSDYYATNDSKFGPTGRVDMMDYSIGDETSYSKMALNWVRPYQVTGSGSITISDFESSGDVILINNNWNKSVLDEYLLLELYSPTYLNEYDANIGNSAAKLMSNPGLKVYHVDSRAAYYNAFSLASAPVAYVESGNCPETSYRIGIAHDNAYSTKNEFSKRSLYHLLENHDKETFKEGAMATIDTMWYVGDDFGETCYKDFTFNNGNKLGYTFTVDALNAKSVTISFTALN